MTDSIPEEFSKVIKDFVKDIKSTFPEVAPLINKWWKDKSSFSNIENIEEREKLYLDAETKSTKFLFKYCQKKFPPRFFEILYQNEDMFKEDSESDTEFLPHIHFKNLWQFDISQKTRDTIWKYLQLIMFSIVGSIDNKEAFGDTSKLFEAINEDEFKTKLQETMEQMSGLFEKSEKDAENASNESYKEGSLPNGTSLPNANDIHAHITGMLDGKLGKLAKEIAEETAAGLNIEMDDATDMKSVFNNLIKNPSKLMGLVKSVGDKLDTRIKSGEIKESELMAEATEIMNKMKDMPGMDNIQSMLNKMGMGGMNMGGGGKMNMGAMKSQLGKNMKMAQMKERMRAKAETNKLAKDTQNVANQNNTVFSTGETVEKTPRGAKPEIEVINTNTNKNKKKKGKK
jgi:hypothetical protein